MNIIQRFPLTPGLLLVVAALAALAVLAALAFVPPSTIFAHPDPETGRLDHPQIEQWGLECIDSIREATPNRPGRINFNRSYHRTHATVSPYKVAWYTGFALAGPGDISPHHPEGLAVEYQFDDKNPHYALRAVDDDIHEGTECVEVSAEAARYESTGRAGYEYRDVTITWDRSYCQIEIVDNDPLRIKGVSVVSTPADGYRYHLGETVEVELEFNGDVVVDGNAGIEIQVGGDRRALTYSRQASARSLVFAYTVQEGDRDDDGISMEDGRLNGHNSIRSPLTDSNPDRAYSGFGTLPRHKVNGVAPEPPTPTIESIELGPGPGSDGFYTAGEWLSVQVTFDMPVRVSGEGRATIDLAIGKTRKQAEWGLQPDGTYLPIEATFFDDGIVWFGYIVQVGDVAEEGPGIPRNSIRLNGARIGTDEMRANLEYAGVFRSPEHPISAPGGL